MSTVRRSVREINLEDLNVLWMWHCGICALLVCPLNDPVSHATFLKMVAAWPKSAAADSRGKQSNCE